MSMSAVYAIEDIGSGDLVLVAGPDGDAEWFAVGSYHTWPQRGRAVRVGLNDPATGEFVRYWWLDAGSTLVARAPEPKERLWGRGRRFGRLVGAE